MRAACLETLDQKVLLSHRSHSLAAIRQMNDERPQPDVTGDDDAIPYEESGGPTAGRDGSCAGAARHGAKGGYTTRGAPTNAPAREPDQRLQRVYRLRCQTRAAGG